MTKARQIPLQDFEFLYQLDQNRNKVTYARITSLTLDNYPIERIEGIVTGGSISLDGRSCVRRTCSLTLTTNNLNINNIYWSLTTRVKIEIGIENNITSAKLEKTNYNITNYYQMYPDIIWFPQGIFILTDFRPSASVNSYTIKLTGKDKMCLLNGDIGGVFNTETQLDIERIFNADGSFTDEKKPLSYIIKEMVHHYAQEDFQNIIIRDIDKLSLKMLTNNSRNTLYLIQNYDTEEIVDLASNGAVVPRHKYYYKNQPELLVNFNIFKRGFVFQTGVGEDNNNLIDTFSHPTFLLMENETLPKVLKKIKNNESLISEDDYRILLKYKINSELFIETDDTTKITYTLNSFEDFQKFLRFNNIIVDDEITNFKDEALIAVLKHITGIESIISYDEYQILLSYGFEDSLFIKHSMYHLKDSIENFQIFLQENNIGQQTEFYEGNYVLIQIADGEDVGYELTETYYPEELIAGVGDTVTSVLDKIIKTFGIFEYFYNTQGQFIFQAKQTYVNTSWDNRIDIEGRNEYYVEPYKVSSNVKYHFEGSRTITTYSSNPQIGKIKNDFTVWGTKKLSSGSEVPIHARYAIDKKPSFYSSYDGINYMSINYFNDTIRLEYSFEIENDDDKDLDLTQDLPLNSNIYPNIILNNEVFRLVDWREVIYQMAKDYYQHNHDDDYSAQLQRNNNKKFFFKKTNKYVSVRPYEKGKTGYEQYYHDINGFWRILYMPEEELLKIKKNSSINTYQSVDIENFETYTKIGNEIVEKKYSGPWNKNILADPSSLIFWFDFFDADSLGLGQFSVTAIGDRPKNIKNENSQAIIYNSVPNVIFINQDLYNEYEEKGRLLTGYNYLINTDIFSQFIEDDRIRISTRSITIQEIIDDLLYNNAYCNEQITLSATPIYYLEPNTLISAQDENRGVNGYYIIDKINLPLDYSGIMTINAIKVPERVY